VSSPAQIRLVRSSGLVRRTDLVDRVDRSLSRINKVRFHHKLHSCGIDGCLLCRIRFCEGCGCYGASLLDDCPGSVVSDDAIQAIESGQVVSITSHYFIMLRRMMKS
jgi:hypothetical protein